MSHASEGRLWRGRPLWLEVNRTPAQRYRWLRGHHETAIAIVGGGITGALIAARFAKAGVPVLVLESDLVGRGSTGASSALLLQEPDQGMAQLARRYGTAASRRIWQLGHEAVRDFLAELRGLRIDCELAERDAVYYATTADAVARLHAEFVTRKKAGFAARWLTAAAMQRLTGIAAAGAIRTAGNAQFDPYKACLGLLEAAASSGAEVFERSAVRRIVNLRERVRLYTKAGRVDAATVIVATGYASNHFRPLAGRFRMYRTYVLATPPLDADARRALGLGELMAWDTERPYHYARWTADHRLLLGGGDLPVRGGQRRDAQFARATQVLREHFETIFPALRGIRTDGWEGLFAMTPDSLPYIGPHQRYPRHLFALGYGGNGMTFGSLAARLLLEQWRGIRSPDQDLFRFGRLRS